MSQPEDSAAQPPPPLDSDALDPAAPLSPTETAPALDAPPGPPPLITAAEAPGSPDAGWLPPTSHLDPPPGPIGPPYGPAAPPAARRAGGAWKWWLLGAAASALVLVITAGVVLWVLVAGASSDEAKIRRLVGDFATAVDRDDQDRILGLLCAAEASDITEDDDFDPADNGGPIVDPGPKRPIRTSDITVTGDTASARVSRTGQPDTTLHFKKESGAWKVCNPSGGGAVATPTPTD